MPFDISSLPPAPTPEQVAKYVVDAANEVVRTVTTAATTAQNTVESTAGQSVEEVNKTVTAVNTAAQAAVADLRTNADRAKNEMQTATDQAVAEFQNLVSEVLKLVGHVPTPAELAIGDVNGEPFYEPLGCFVFFMKAINEDNNPITVNLREPTVAQSFRDFVGATQDEIARKAREKFMARISTIPTPPAGGSSNIVDPGTTILAVVPPPVWIILAIAALVLAVAVSIFVVLMAVAIIYALYKNYDIENARLGFDTPLGGLTFGVTFTH